MTEAAATATASSTPEASSQGRPNRSACSSADAASRFDASPAGHPPMRMPSATAYHGSKTNPADPVKLQAIALRRGPLGILFRLARDLFFPALDQPLPLGLRAVLGEV